MIPIEAGVFNLSASLPETVIYSSNRGWSGRMDYQAYVKTASVGTLGVTFRWQDRLGNTLTHNALGLALIATGIIVSQGFQLSTRNFDPSTVTLTLTLAGLVGTPLIDFWANGFGVAYD